MKRLKQLPDKELDALTIGYWHEISHDPRLTKLLNHLEQNHKGRFSESRVESPHPHIQQERNGGTKAWNRLCSLLLNPPAIPIRDEDSVTEKTTKKKYKQTEFKISHTD